MQDQDSRNLPGSVRPKPRLLVIGQAVNPTGYARVIHSVLAEITEKYEIHHFGLNYKGEKITKPWIIHPNRLPGDIHGAKQIPRLIQDLKPDLIWIVHDLYLFSLLKQYVSFGSLGCKTIAYAPIENRIVKEHKLRDIQSLDCLVLYNEYAKCEVSRAYSASFEGRERPKNPSLRVIGHGTDPKRFYPLISDHTKADLHANRIFARQKLFPNRPELSDAFIVLNANRNSMRKRIDLTLKAFEIFAKDKPESVYLFLHMGMSDRGCDILEMAEKLGIVDRLLLTSARAERPDVDDDSLNLIYNACDVGLNTSTGEGWGLVAFEHAATGAAQIMPAHGTCKELWERAAVLIEPSSYEKDNFDFVVHGIVAPESVASTLNAIYHNPALLHSLSISAYERAISARQDWTVIANQWDSIFQDALANRL
ncbi:D-inositol-3-phosphate glycosyltransferase [uncultured archaeon]|nr:D-inositol-3-phosphate glycosyltransferase [uncultured archaeon]